jgi:hypothetical protein
MGFLRVHFEEDAKSVIDLVHSDGVDSNGMGHLIEDIKWELQDFHQWKLTFVKRGGNQVAHLFAQYVVKQSQDCKWRDIPLECIRETILLKHFALAL